MTGLHVLAAIKGLLLDVGVPYLAGAFTMGAIWILWWVFQPPADRGPR